MAGMREGAVGIVPASHTVHVARVLGSSRANQQRAGQAWRWQRQCYRHGSIAEYTRHWHATVIQGAQAGGLNNRPIPTNVGMFKSKREHM